MKKKANNVRYIVDKKSLMHWCEEKGYPYNAAVQMLTKSRLTINQMKSRLKENYYSSAELNQSMNTEAYHLSLIYFKSTREKRLKIRKDFTTKFSKNKGFEKCWESIVNGKFKDFNDKDIEFWKKIKGDPKLEVSNKGNFRRWLNAGCRKIKTFEGYQLRKSGNKHHFLLIKTKRKKHAENAARLVAESFLEKGSKDMVIYYIDGNSKNIDSSNLKWVTQQMSGMLTGFNFEKSKSVILIDDENNVVEEFESIRQAGLELGISHTTAFNYCHQNIKKPRFKLIFKEV